MYFFVAMVSISSRPSLRREHNIRCILGSRTECTNPLLQRPGGFGEAIKQVSRSCVIYSYIGSNGVARTNSDDKFNCCDNLIESMQYPGSEERGPEGEAKWISSVMEEDYHFVKTSNRDTCQKLLGYDERCTQRYNYDGSFGSTSTEDQCNDPTLVPEMMRSWVVDSNANGKQDLIPSPEQQNGEEQSSSFLRKPIAETVSVTLFAGFLFLF